jgi:hypothetical protein
MRAHAGTCIGVALIAGLGLGCATPRPARVEMPADEMVSVLAQIETFRGLRLDILPTLITLSPAEFTRWETEDMRQSCRRRKTKPEAGSCGPASLAADEDCEKLEADPPRKNEAFHSGFYHADRQTIVLLDMQALLEDWGWSFDKRELDEERATSVAHELQHYLQYVHYPLKDTPGADKEPDELAALTALKEGDATLVGAIYGAKAMGYDWKFRLEKMLHQSQTSMNQGSSYHAARPAWVGGVKNIDPAIDFGSYTAGLAFVVELYHRGGFAAVDRAYASPPRSTEQVLHPAKYISGELPVEVPAHALPAGLEASDSERFGELYVRAILSTCTGWLRSCDMATGWAGDRWTWIKEGGKTKALVWTLVWDREEDAKKFYAPPDPRDRCLKDSLSAILRGYQRREVAPGSKDWRVDIPVTARIRGRRTGYVVGLPPEQAEPILEAFFAAPIADPPPAPPPQ